jgi:hypothetical protein
VLSNRFLFIAGAIVGMVLWWSVTRRRAAIRTKSNVILQPWMAVLLTQPLNRKTAAATALPT